MRRSLLKSVALMMIASMILAACGGPAATPVPEATATTGTTTEAPTTAAVEPTKETTAPEQLPRNETLYIGGLQWQPPVNFNPLNGNPDWPGMNGHMLTYEALFAYNLLTGALDPMLAKELKMTDDTTMQVTLQDGTKWQDGQDLTTDDVIYTFGLAKTQPDINYNTFFDYVTDVKATGDRTLEFKLNPESLNPGFVKDFLIGTRILPKHIWEPREKTEGDKLSQVIDTAPVGSGPYKLLNFAPERIALVRDDNYWGKAAYGLPAPKYVVHPIFKTNDAGNLAFQNGDVDLMQQFTPQIWKMWEEKNLPVGTWYKNEPYYIPGSIPMLIVNTTKKGLDNPAVRRALAYSINYPLIAETAMSKYSVPANSSLIIPEGGEKDVFNEANVKANGWTYDPAKAKDILENELKATKGSDGVYVLPDGTRLGPWSARTPKGWTDWQTAINIVVQSANEAGFQLTEDYPEAPVVTSKIQNGDFDLNLWYIAGAGPASPWKRFRDMLDDRGVAAIGERANWDYGRFKDPAVPALLDEAGKASNPKDAQAAYDKLDEIFMKNAPGIPLMYRPFEFYEFNEKYWTGFPTSEDPSAPPTFQFGGVKVLYQVKPK
jgi:peptide/nickel transport system substrate-binding protein